MEVKLSIILTALSILGIIGGFIGWVLGRILTDKKDKLTLTFKIERIEQMLLELKIDIDKIDPIQLELEKIKEQIKHL